MGYSTRSLSALLAEARQSFASAIEGAVVSVWPNTFTVIAKALALIGREQEDRRAYLYDQMFRSSCDASWLDRHGYEDGLSRNPGVAASGLLTVGATSGLVVPAGLRFTRVDGSSYTTTASATAGASNALLPIEADEPGASYNTAAAAVLTLTADAVAPTGLAAAGVVAAPGLTGGLDDEPIADFRKRLLDRRRYPPAGGSAPDYLRWVGDTLGAAIVRGVYVEPFTSDPGAIWLQFTVSDQPNGVPSAGQVATVQAYLNDPIRKPITARVYVSAPSPIAVPITITGLAPDTSDTRASITAELSAFFLDAVEPGRPSTPYRLRVDDVRAAIRRGAGRGAGFTLTSPAADVDCAAGTMPVRGVITWA